MFLKRGARPGVVRQANRRMTPCLTLVLHRASRDAVLWGPFGGRLCGRLAEWAPLRPIIVHSGSTLGLSPDAEPVAARWMPPPVQVSRQSISIKSVTAYGGSRPLYGGRWARLCPCSLISNVIYFGQCR